MRLLLETKIESLKSFAQNRGTSYSPPGGRNGCGKKYENDIKYLRGKMHDLALLQNMAPHIDDQVFTTGRVSVRYTFTRPVEPIDSCTSQKPLLVSGVVSAEEQGLATVYIKEIVLLNDSNAVQGGFYGHKATGLSGRGSVKAINDPKLEKRVVYIGSPSDNKNKAMEIAKYSTGHTKPLLFLIPPSVSDSLSQWKSKSLNSEAKKLVHTLSKAMKSNQGKQVEWVIEKQGAELLRRALPLVPGNLKSHKFKFINANTDLPALISSLNTKNTQLEGQFLDYIGDRSALMAFADPHKTFKSLLESLPVSKNGYERTTRKHLIKSAEHFSDVATSTRNSIYTQMQSINRGATTFIQAIVAANGSRGRQKR